MPPGRPSPCAFRRRPWLSRNTGLAAPAPLVLVHSQARGLEGPFESSGSRPHPLAPVKNLSRTDPLLPAPLPPSGPAAISPA